MFPIFTIYTIFTIFTITYLLFYRAVVLKKSGGELGVAGIQKKKSWRVSMGENNTG